MELEDEHEAISVWKEKTAHQFGTINNDRSGVFVALNMPETDKHQLAKMYQQTHRLLTDNDSSGLQKTISVPNKNNLRFSNANFNISLVNGHT